MSLSVYPVGLPLPLRDGYGLEAVNGIRSTPMDSGRSRQRMEFTRRPSELTLNWILTPPEARLFQAWVEQVAGAGWFAMVLVTPLGWTTEKVRFKATPKGGELVGRYSWRFSALCEVEWTPLLPPGWAALLPSFILHPEIFDYAMNEEWPLHPWQTYILQIDEAINQEWPTP